MVFTELWYFCSIVQCSLQQFEMSFIIVINIDKKKRNEIDVEEELQKEMFKNRRETR